MTDHTLIIGDKHLSSWSLRPWFLMKQAGIPFTEHKVLLDRPESRANLAKVSPSGLVPVLKTPDTEIWDSLSIAEYLNEAFPEKQLWPTDVKARAHARSISAAMHSGFSSLRIVWPMMFARENLKHTTSGGVQRDVDRIVKLWTDARKNFGGNGPFLYGGFSIADAMFAPVASRFKTYGPLAMTDEARAWMTMLLALPVLKEWGTEAAEEFAAR